MSYAASWLGVLVAKVPAEVLRTAPVWMHPGAVRCQDWLEIILKSVAEGLFEVLVPVTSCKVLWRTLVLRTLAEVPCAPVESNTHFLSISLGKQYAYYTTSKADNVKNTNFMLPKLWFFLWIFLDTATNGLKTDSLCLYILWRYGKLPWSDNTTVCHFAQPHATLGSAKILYIC